MIGLLRHVCHTVAHAFSSFTVDFQVVFFLPTKSIYIQCIRWSSGAVEYTLEHRITKAQKHWSTEALGAHTATTWTSHHTVAQQHSSTTAQWHHSTKCNRKQLYWVTAHSVHWCMKCIYTQHCCTVIYTVVYWAPKHQSNTATKRSYNICSPTQQCQHGSKH